ncbi:hypothetical protein ACJIZ3_013531 [Penstemon smallii]|uniref:Uncharacterized protein n=1 Tax=Penstemon smallii TaxID=265156 RepID=A0ABD3RHA8_9LAMI
MRDLPIQTPQRTPQIDHTSANRRSNSTSDAKRNLHKVAKKSLSTEFTAVLEKNSSVSEPAKEVSDNPFIESAENFITPLNPVETPISKTIYVSDLTPSSSSTITFDKSVCFDALENKCEIPIDSSNNIESIEAEMVIDRLREARIKVMNSTDLSRSKSLLDALINVIIEEFCEGVYEEKDWLDKLLSNKCKMVVLTSVLWILVISVGWFFILRSKGLHTGPPPT